MTQNKLKIIACLSMLIDHAGLLLFPSVTVMRYIGRLAMPLFAYFVAEGCIHTRSKVKYFLQVFSLAVICQAVYFVEDMMSGGIRDVSLNILFTFAVAIGVCAAYLELTDALSGDSLKRQLISAGIFTATLTAVFFGMYFLERLPVPLTFDYGFAGVVLVLFGAFTSDKRLRLPVYIIGLILFNAMISPMLDYTWYSLLAIPLLLIYNGKRGTKKLKWAFYLFYPVHFALLYFLSLVM